MDSEPATRIKVTRFESPLGELVAAATDAGLCLLGFADGAEIQPQLSQLQALLGAELAEGMNPFLEFAKQQIEEYFLGRRREFELPLLMPGTPFQSSAWEYLRTIPYGQTRSYGDQAKALGRPTAARAVAAADGNNRIAIIVPCHRVIGASGSLTGYAGGLRRKRFLLDLESSQPELR